MSLFKALRMIQSAGEGSVPQVAAKFQVSTSTADNWLRRGLDRGFLKASRPKDQEGVKGTVGRPPMTYTVTAKGSKVVAAGEIPGDKSGYRMEGRKAPKAKSKAKAPKAKSKAKAPKAKAPKAKAPKAKAPKAKAPKAKGRKPLTEAQREAKRAKDRARRAKGSEVTPAPAEAAA